MNGREIKECKSCGSEDLYLLSSKGKDYLVCEDCGQVHRIK